MGQPALQAQLRNDFRVRVTFPQWPSPTVSTQTYALVARAAGADYGSLIAAPNDFPPASASVVHSTATTARKGRSRTQHDYSSHLKRPALKYNSIQDKTNSIQDKTNSNNTISYDAYTGMSMGVPIIGELFQIYVDVPIISVLPLTPHQHTLVFMSQPLAEETRFCGTPNATLLTSANQEVYQVYAMLYDVDLFGIGVLLSHAPWTRWNATLNHQRVTRLNFRSLCVDVSKGHRLALGVALHLPCTICLRRSLPVAWF